MSQLREIANIFIVNGRLAACEIVVGDLSVESLSLSRTEAHLGYPFDFTTAGTEEQDDRQLNNHRDNMSDAERKSAIPIAQLPDADQHRKMVDLFRKNSAPYYDLQQIVRLLVLLREWREEEQTLIQSVILPHSFSQNTSANIFVRLRQDRQKDAAALKQKPDTHRTRQIYESISTMFDNLIPAISEHAAADPNYLTKETWELMKAYIPEIIIAYLSVLQSASWFLNKEPSVKAMEVAVLVADAENKWVQACLLETGRMSEVVDCLAQVSRAMLRLQAGSKDALAKKRGGKGETLRLWDLGAR